jgi:glycosyltransferase A (GT-A) superfamily protein (DUF2064 family)
VYCAATADVPKLQQWLQNNCTPLPVHPQLQTADLGRRMLAAMTHAATTASFSPAQQERYMACRKSSHQCHAQVLHDASDTSHYQQHLLTQVQQQQQQLRQTQTSDSQELHGHAMKDAGRTQADLASGQQRTELLSTCTGQHHSDNHWSHSAVLVVGTDIPDLSAGIFSAAIHSITQQGYEMILGPAKDGGFYLLGFSAAALLKPEVQAGSVFAGVVWSSESVLQKTFAAAQQLGLNVAPLETLPALHDIDTVEDLQAWWQEQAGQDSCEASLAAQTDHVVADPCNASSRCTQETAAASGLRCPCQVRQWVAELLAQHTTH